MTSCPNDECDGGHRAVRASWGIGSQDLSPHYEPQRQLCPLFISLIVAM